MNFFCIIFDFMNPNQFVFTSFNAFSLSIFIYFNFFVFLYISYLKFSKKFIKGFWSSSYLKMKLIN